jgi:hypothetical protein
MNRIDEIISKSRRNFSQKSQMLVSKENFKKLGAFEQKMIKDVSVMLSLIGENDQVDLKTLKSLFESILENKPDPEKMYLVGLLYPSKIKKPYFPHIFPMKVVARRQEFNLAVKTNANGDFLMQVCAPFMGLNSEISPSVDKCDIFFSNNINLSDSSPLTLNTQYQKITNGFVDGDLYDAFVLVACTVTVKYIGRLDKLSGYLMGGYTISQSDLNTLDYSYSTFNSILRSNNAVKTNSTAESLKLVYFPPDNSFFEFKRPGNSIASGNNINHRLLIGGRGIENDNTSTSDNILVEIERVYACIPNAKSKDAFEQIEADTVDYKQIIDFIISNRLAVTKDDDTDKYTNLMNIPFSLDGMKQVDKVDKLLDTDFLVKLRENFK